MPWTDSLLPTYADYKADFWGEWGMVVVALVIYLLSAAYVLSSLGRPTKRASVLMHLPAQRVATLGLLAAVAAMMQSSPHFLPGIGLVLATLSSLPIAVGALIAPSGSLPMVLATAAILMIVQLEEAFVFALTTAPLGLAAAWAVTEKRPLWQAFGLPGVALASGIILMSDLLGVPALGPGVHHLGPLLTTVVYAAFGCLYASVWVGLIAKIKSRVLQKFGDYDQ